MFIFINGKILPSHEAFISIDDLGFHRGYAVTDFFLCIDGVPLYVEQHLNRFYKSMAAFHLHIPQSKLELQEIINDLAQRCQQKSMSIKVIATGGNSKDSYTPSDTPTLVIIPKFFTPVDTTQPLKLMICDYERDIYAIKSTNYAFGIQQLPLLKQKGFNDLVYQKEGIISESSRSNIFIVKNNVLKTSNVGALEGITRANILDEARKLNIKTVESPITVAELLEADEVFLSSTTRLIHPVTQIDEKQFAIGVLSLKLQAALVQRAETYIKNARVLA